MGSEMCIRDRSNSLESAIAVAQGIKYTDLKSIRALDPSDSAGERVDFEATVTHVCGMRGQIFETAHRLKGSAGTVMAERIENAASAIELAARDGHLEMIESQVTEMLREFEQFSDAIRHETNAV